MNQRKESSRTATSMTKLSTKPKPINGRPVSRNTNQRARGSFGGSSVHLPTANWDERIGMAAFVSFADLSIWTSWSERIRRWSARDTFFVDSRDRSWTTNLVRVKERMHVLAHGYLPDSLFSCNAHALTRAPQSVADHWKNEIEQFSTKIAKRIDSSTSYPY